MSVATLPRPAGSCPPAVILLTRPHHLGGALAQIRRRRGVTQRWLAEATRFRQPQIASWEIGGSRPNAESLIRLADALGYDLALIPREEA